MLKDDRQGQILHKLALKGKIVASKLAVELNVSEDTIRRDLLELDQNGKLKRVYGGALPISRRVVDYLERENRNLDIKQRMAAKALQFISEDQLVAIDGSSANLVLVRAIPADLKLTVVTNSYPIAQACMEKRIDVYMVGGHLLRETLTVVGTDAERQAREYHPDICFMGVYGIHPEFGLTIPYQPEVGIKRQFIAVSGQVISLVNPTKFNTVSKFFLSELEGISTLVTDEGVEDAVLEEYRARGLECV
ncbi:MAG: DeoR/GlpR family DNA-binding transcription regulator [Lachnospiraceae bacterium]|jgi:DeoR/GlpR family transcriptional regulator of sugar metabolism|nr:DeoR/GlpR family DNA-binding transcription regulator [Lachnospiraceae bacterium]